MMDNITGKYLDSHKFCLFMILFYFLKNKFITTNYKSIYPKLLKKSKYFFWVWMKYILLHLLTDGSGQIAKVLSAVRSLKSLNKSLKMIKEKQTVNIQIDKDANYY